MEEFIKYLKLDKMELDNLPLFYRIILYNELNPITEESKLTYFNKIIQVDKIRSDYPKRAISKTINHKLFLSKDEEK